MTARPTRSPVDAAPVLRFEDVPEWARFEDMADDSANDDVDTEPESWGWRAALVILTVSCALWFGVVATVRWVW